MAEAKSKAKATEEKAETAEAPADDSFPVERLVSEPGFLPDYPAHVVAGALAGSSKKNLSLAEAEAACEKWLASEVEVDSPEEA